ncbi:hypothetical protein [Paraherbaspirillum soli]|uniref:Flagellar biosynthetic protein FliO n=1 Tax=Paraherbaspirillum soli TaxID=631222 RepID=A0ABW0MET9_9BURK
MAELTGGGAAPSIDYVRIALAFAVCVLLAIVWIGFVKRTSFGLKLTRDQGAARLKLVQSVRLNARTTVYLLECDGASVLLACDPDGTKVISGGHAGSGQVGGSQ